MNNYRVFKNLREALLATTAFTTIQFRPGAPKTNAAAENARAL